MPLWVMQMVALHIMIYPKASTRQTVIGLTLIEVLIALAIIGIALTAIIKASSQTIRGTTYLQQKMIALWEAEQVMNAARIGVLSLPKAPDYLERSTQILGETWYYRADQRPTRNARIKQLTVQLFQREIDEGEPVMTLESYVYQ